MSSLRQNATWLQEMTIDLGADLFGVCGLDSYDGPLLLSEKELEGLVSGVVLGVALASTVLSGISDRPTLLYKWHYRQANNLLDHIAFRATQAIINRGFRALPIPSSQIVDWEGQKGHVSHRGLAVAAGMGWRGRNNLLVNKEFGAHVRLVSILTDLPLEAGCPVDNSCGSCRQCVSLCPVGALGEDAGEYNFDRCFNHLKTHSKLPGIGQYICGICVKACQGKRN